MAEATKKSNSGTILTKLREEILEVRKELDRATEENIQLKSIIALREENSRLTAENINLRKQLRASAFKQRMMDELACSHHATIRTLCRQVNYLQQWIAEMNIEKDQVEVRQTPRRRSRIPVPVRLSRSS